MVQLYYHFVEADLKNKHCALVHTRGGCRLAMIQLIEFEMKELLSLYGLENLSKRKVRIYLPPCYEVTTDTAYPVVYMHDGQNLFDKSDAAYGEIWNAHGAVESLINETFKGAIIIGIDNAEGLYRLDEYSPWISTEVEVLKGLNLGDRKVGGYGKFYGDFILQTLKPWVDRTYRTKPSRENTAIIGSSMGGYISLYLGATYPHVFGMVGAFSTAAWFNQNALLTCLKDIDLSLPTRWYLDVGTKETSNEAISHFNELYVSGSQEIVNTLTERGVSLEFILFVVDEGGIHNEKDWARRLPHALKWLFSLR